MARSAPLPAAFRAIVPVLLTVPVIESVVPLATEWVPDKVPVSAPMIGSTAVEAALVLPAASVAVAVNTWEPLANTPVL